ncbi:MAG TPA: hypothetical protein VFF84_13830 [Sphingobium sp.]|nr:hypothetical protein [Sphingobium sp.]
MTTNYFPRARQPSALALQAEALVARYPDLSDHELANLIDIFPYVSILDRGLMSADPRLSEKLAAFHRDHGRKLKAPGATLIAFLAFPTLVAAGVLWWLFA